MTVSLSFRTEEQTRALLDQNAKILDRNRNWVINEAIRMYLEHESWKRQEIEAAIKESDAGKGYTTTQLRQRLRKGGIKVKN